MARTCQLLCARRSPLIALALLLPRGVVPQTATYAYTVLRQPHLQMYYNLYSMSAGVSLGGCAIWVRCAHVLIRNAVHA